jgi:cobaltochelatase CobS
MTTVVKPPSPKVEDLVKKALKEALDKRKPPKTTEASTDVSCETTIDDPKELMASAPHSTLKPNQVYLSEVIGQPVDHDFGITVFQESDWDERIAAFVPSINSTYVIDPKLASDILQAWELNEKVLCYGPTGAGKSSLIEQLCARTYRPFVRVNCTGDMDSSMIFGQLTAKDGSTIWVDGAATEAVKYGAVFAWDEWDVTPPEISMGLQWLLEDDGKLFLKEMPGSTKDKQIIPHKDFRLVAIGNTQGQGDDTGAHAGTNVQNSATLDRFGTAVFVDYLPAAVEEKIITSK